jgi:hypothetical protein
VVDRIDESGREKQTVRVIARGLSNGDVLVIGRNVDEVGEIASVVGRALALECRCGTRRSRLFAAGAEAQSDRRACGLCRKGYACRCLRLRRRSRRLNSAPVISRKPIPSPCSTASIRGGFLARSRTMKMEYFRQRCCSSIARGVSYAQARSNDNSSLASASRSQPPMRDRQLW